MNTASAIDTIMNLFHAWSLCAIETGRRSYSLKASSSQESNAWGMAVEEAAKEHRLKLQVIICDICVKSAPMSTVLFSNNSTEKKKHLANFWF